MNAFVQKIRDNVTYDARSVHYNKRAYDKQFEIVARAEVEGVFREVVLDIQPSRTKALEVVQFLRGHNTDA